MYRHEDWCYFMIHNVFLGWKILATSWFHCKKYHLLIHIFHCHHGIRLYLIWEHLDVIHLVWCEFLFLQAWYRRGKANASLGNNKAAVLDLTVAVNMEPSLREKRQIESELKVFLGQNNEKSSSLRISSENCLDSFGMCGALIFSWYSYPLLFWTLVFVIFFFYTFEIALAVYLFGILVRVVVCDCLWKSSKWGFYFAAA